MNVNKIKGLIAATYTPLHGNGALNLGQIAPMVEYLLTSGVRGLYVCGSTGEGMSLSGEERRVVAEEYVKVTAGRVPVIIQVGHNSLAEAKQLAVHAQEIGADIISATCPSYFKVNSNEVLLESMAEIASGAPDLPFYYYHIPALTGSTINIVEFLKFGKERIPNLVGLKYTDTALYEFQQCFELNNEQFDVVWGCDEMLLGALATGARGSIGSTFNVAAPLYYRIIKAHEKGDLTKARQLQSLSILMIRTLAKYPFHPAMKEVLKMLGIDMGQCRLPQKALSSEDIKALQKELKAIGFFEWNLPDKSAGTNTNHSPKIKAIP